MISFELAVLISVLGDAGALFRKLCFGIPVSQLFR